MFNDGIKVTMRDVVRELRLQRHGSVQTDIQYVYIHRCILALSENRKVPRFLFNFYSALSNIQEIIYKHANLFAKVIN